MSDLGPASADLLRPRNGLAFMLIFCVAGALAAAVVWSTQARMVEVSSGQGRVIPSGRVKVVQNLEGGIVQLIHVQEGATVEKGAPLVSIDPIQVGAVLAENRIAIRALAATTTWLQALLDGKEPDFGQPQDQQHAKVIARNRAEFVSTREEAQAALHSLDRLADQKELEIAETRSRLASIRASLEVANEQFAIMAKLHESLAASRADYLTAKSRKLELAGQAKALELTLPRVSAARSEIAAKRDEQIARFHAKLSLRLNEASTKLAALRKTETVDADRVLRAQLRAPVRGIVKTLHANTIGQVVKPAEKIVEIVPVDDALLVRVEVSPKDIAFLHQGQEAVVKLTAYDYALYGTLKGRVVRIGADSIIDDQGNTHFPVDVKGDVNWIESDDKRLPVLPGMVAQVDIVTGHKTVFDYITKPIHRTATGAFGER